MPREFSLLARTAVIRESDPRIDGLRSAMGNFYATTTGYFAFDESSQQTQFWRGLVPCLDDAIASAKRENRRARVLEFGAGRTGFSEFLGARRPDVEFSVQDVTDRNRDHLDRVADRVIVGEVPAIDGRFDLIFSTFVWEHLACPARDLEHLLGLLAPGGSLVLASPRYDLPGYIPPSARHLPRAQRWALAGLLVTRRLRVALGASPDFLIHSEPACLEAPWYRDADAIHWASAFDLRHLRHSYRIERLSIPTRGFKNWVWARYALLFVRIRPNNGG
jgi:SAM-dependent methyltransferase